MKSICLSIFLCVTLIFNSSVSKSQTKEDIELLHNGLRMITLCQANFKIAAYYYDIYQSYKIGLENLTIPQEEQMTSDLTNDWIRAEDLAVKIQNVLLPLYPNIRSENKTLYTSQQRLLLETALTVKGTRDIIEHVNKIFKRVSDCTDRIDEIESNLVR